MLGGIDAIPARRSRYILQYDPANCEGRKFLFSTAQGDGRRTDGTDGIWLSDGVRACVRAWVRYSELPERLGVSPPWRQRWQLEVIPSNSSVFSRL